MTRRFPGCNELRRRGATSTTPSPTQSGRHVRRNLKCLCRKHHPTQNLLGAGHTAGVIEQLPDGTLIWTSPTGQTYTTPSPAAARSFPALSRPTAPDQPAGSGRGGRPRAARPRPRHAQTATHPRARPQPTHQHRTPTQRDRRAVALNDTNRRNGQPAEMPRTDHGGTARLVRMIRHSF